MINERAQTQNLIQLSAYLDDALSASQKEKLEYRLEREPELRERLENLRRTKIILGSLPRLQAPHHFTLTPEMVKVRQPKRNPLLPTLRLATSLAAILLVVLFGVELLLGGDLLSGRLTSQVPMMEAARVAEDATPEPLIQWGPMGEGGYGGYGGDGVVTGKGDETFAMEEPVEELEAAPPVIEEETLPEMEAEELPAEMPETAPDTELAPMPEEELGTLDTEEQAAQEKELILGINPDRGGEIISRSEPIGQSEDSPLTWPNILQWAMLALAAITLGGGITLLVLRIKRKTFA